MKIFKKIWKVGNKKKIRQAYFTWSNKLIMTRLVTWPWLDRSSRWVWRVMSNFLYNLSGFRRIQSQEAYFVETSSYACRALDWCGHPPAIEVKLHLVIRDHNFITTIQHKIIIITLHFTQTITQFGWITCDQPLFESLSTQHNHCRVKTNLNKKKEMFRNKFFGLWAGCITWTDTCHII